MSPSRIPRPGASNGSPSPGTTTTTTTPTTIASPTISARATNGSPALGTIVPAGALKANNPFAQLHNKQLRAHVSGQNPGSPTPTSAQNSPTLANGVNGKLLPSSQAGTVRRRPKPPAADGEDGTLISANPPNPLNLSRRPMPDGSGVPRNQMRTASGPHPTPNGSEVGGGHRSILRQPSTPALSSSTTDRHRGAHTAPPLGVMRARAASSSTASATSAAGKALALQTQSANGANKQKTITGGGGGGGVGGMRSLPSQHLFEPSFAEHREPAVPPHIRVRLRLIHQLGVVLGIDAIGISGKIDIPGLLARVDAAYERGPATHAAPLTGAGADGVGGGEGASALPLPKPANAPVGGRQGGGGVFGMFRRLGRKSAGDEAQAQNYAAPTPPEGPAFGVPLSEAPGGSWCTSLIGGQRHELPLVVFTVVEEIYRRGMSQPGIFRLAGDGTRISSLTKVFNLPPLYGDSLTITSEPIHNLTGLVKRYVRDMPEPILDESLFEAFLAFCVVDDGEVTQDNVNSAIPLAEDGTEHGRQGLDNEGNNDEPVASSTSTVQETSNINTPASPPSPTLTDSALPLATRIHAAQILLKLLPPLQFSLFIYLLAFLGQLPLFPDNRLNVESISIIFGPAMCAARGKGISGLGNKPAAVSSGASGGGAIGDGDDSVSDLVGRSQSVLGWLLRNWAAISEKVLDIEDELPSTPPLSSSTSTSGLGGLTVDTAEGGKKKKDKKQAITIDPRLLSPIDLRGSHDRARKGEAHAKMPISTSTTNIIHASQVTSDGSSTSVPKEVGRTWSPVTRGGSASSNESDTPSLSHSSTQSPASAVRSLPTPTSSPNVLPNTNGGRALRSSASSGALRSSTSITTSGFGIKSSPSTSFAGDGAGGMKSSPSSGGLFARAFSSMSISSQAGDQPLPRHEQGSHKEPKRSASFTSLSSLVRKVGSSTGSSHGGGMKGGPSMSTSRTSVVERDTANSGVNSQITTVLGSLHDLLVSKDKQIERDARELALLRHTLLEMDEKLQRTTFNSPLPGPVGINGCTCPSHPNAYVGAGGRFGNSPPDLQQGQRGGGGGGGGGGGPTPEITITSTPSASTIPTLPSFTSSVSVNGVNVDNLQKEILDLQAQLTTALASLETGRQASRRQSDKVIQLESAVNKRNLEISKFQVQLALEQARCQGLIEERDLAKERLEKVKTTLFSVA